MTIRIDDIEYRLVPRDQTEDMESRAVHALNDVRARLGKDLSDESLVGVIYNAMFAAAPAPTAALAVAQEPMVVPVEEIMTKVQEFASTWATVDGQFDDGTALDRAEQLRTELRAALTATKTAAAAKRPT